jgi:hypothetical protein
MVLFGSRSHEHVARGYLAVQVVQEVDPSRNVVDVHKQVLTPERLGEPVVQPTGRRLNHLGGS